MNYFCAEDKEYANDCVFPPPELLQQDVLHPDLAKESASVRQTAVEVVAHAVARLWFKIKQASC